MTCRVGGVGGGGVVRRGFSDVGLPRQPTKGAM